jgi:hypothetical protein
MWKHDWWRLFSLPILFAEIVAIVSVKSHHHKLLKKDRYIREKPYTLLTKSAFIKEKRKIWNRNQKQKLLRVYLHKIAMAKS